MAKASTRQPPAVVVIAGPNGAGKSTAAPGLLRGALRVSEFVNADVIARGLSAFNPEGAAITAGRIMLARLRDLARAGTRFAFETTLASRSLAPWIRELVESGYSYHLLFLSLPSADLAVERVRARVQAGGHNVPEATIRRRFERGLRTFVELYQPLATSWRVYDNSRVGELRLIASGGRNRAVRCRDAKVWREILKAASSR